MIAYDLDEADDLPRPRKRPPRTRRDTERDMLAQRRRRERFRKLQAEPVEKPQITYVQLVAEVRRISMGGVMPTPQRFDECKYTHFGKAAELCDALGVTWQMVAEDAGLRMRGRV